MNVVFRMANNDLETQFVAEAADSWMSGLTGHRGVGGCRASMYNAMSLAGTEALREFMVKFQRRKPGTPC